MIKKLINTRRLTKIKGELIHFSSGIKQSIQTDSAAIKEYLKQINFRHNETFLEKDKL